MSAFNLADVLAHHAGTVEIEHRLSFAYDAFIRESFLELRMQPKTTAHQALSSFVLAVGPNVQAKNLAEFLAAADVIVVAQRDDNADDGAADAGAIDAVVGPVDMVSVDRDAARRRRSRSIAIRR